MSPWLNLRRTLALFGPLIAVLAVEVLLFEALGRAQGTPGFASPQAVVLVLNQAAIFGIMAVGMTFVILTGGIDLSVGSVAACAGVIAALLVRDTETVGVGIAAGWAAALAFGGLAGAAAGGLVSLLRVPPFIATLALMSTLRGAANLLTSGKPVAPLPDAYALPGRHAIAGQIPVSLLIFLAVLAFGAVLLNGTRFGRHVRAIGGNEEAARLSGIQVARVKFLVYVLCGVLTALAGLILSSRLGSGSPKVGAGDELAVIAAVVVGGTSLSGGRGTIGGTFAGLLVIAVLNSGLNWIGVETFGQQVTLGLVILGAVLLDRIKPGA